MCLMPSVTRSPSWSETSGVTWTGSRGGSLRARNLRRSWPHIDRPTNGWRDGWRRTGSGCGTWRGWVKNLAEGDVMSVESTPKNRTRRSRSIPRRLLREGRPHLVPLYYLMRLSDLGREGIDHSGSFRFADHIYRGTASGRTLLGRLIDARLLAMPAARAFRRRCERAQDVIREALESYPSDTEPLRMLAVPCGIPRDMINLSATLRTVNPGLLARLEYHGLDIDPVVLDIAGRLTKECGLAAAYYHRGDALDPGHYPSSRFH